MIASVEVTPDFKPEPRIVDPPVLRLAMRLNEERNNGRCHACKRARAQDPHHIIFKSHQGDDLLENIVPLCVNCHVTFHRGIREDQDEVARNIGASFTDETLIYVMRKLGVDQGQYHLQWRYHRGVPRKLQERLRAELNQPRRPKR